MPVAGTLQKTRIYLKGPLTIETGNVLVDESRFSGRQERTALAYLALNRSRPVSRQELAETIWPDEMPWSWQTSLRAIISRLRGLLREARLGSEPVLQAGEGYRLNPDADLWVDLEAALASLEEAESCLRAGRVADAFSPATVAVVILDRPFANCVEGPWVEQERGRQRRLHQRAQECLAEIWLARGEAALAVECALQAIADDATAEGAYRLLMQAYDAMSNRAEAIRSYHRLQRLLVEELGVSPSAETEAIYLNLLD